MDEVLRSVRLRMTAQNGRAGSDGSGVITMRCLRCAHQGVLREVDLLSFGEKPGAPIARFIKRVVCSECGSHSVEAQRRVSPKKRA